MAKINTTICIDSDVFFELQAKGINKSKAINDFLRTFLELPKLDEDMKKCTLKNEIEKKRVELAQLSTQLEEYEEQEKDVIDLETLGGAL